MVPIPSPAGGFNLVIERLLISGIASCIMHRSLRFLFQSRYRAASHFRPRDNLLQIIDADCFNLVIERLLISGYPAPRARSRLQMFQSRYRAASHFRPRNPGGGVGVK